jgi:hypothetical protein
MRDDPRTTFWSDKEIAMLDAALRAGMDIDKCKALFPKRTHDAVASKMRKRRRELCMPRPGRGRPISEIYAHLPPLGFTVDQARLLSNAEDGSRRLLKRQLQTGQYFGAARAEWLARHDRFAA